MADPMKIRAAVVGEETEVKVLMSHEMETGQRKDAKGQVIPPWFIQNVTAVWNDCSAPYVVPSAFPATARK